MAKCKTCGGAEKIWTEWKPCPECQDHIPDAGKKVPPPPNDYGVRVLRPHGTSTDPRYGVTVGDVTVSVGYDRGTAYAFATAIRKAIANARTQALDEANAIAAVKHADALLAELEKGKPNAT